MIEDQHNANFGFFSNLEGAPPIKFTQGPSSPGQKNSTGQGAHTEGLKAFLAIPRGSKLERELFLLARVFGTKICLWLPLQEELSEHSIMHYQTSFDNHLVSYFLLKRDKLFVK
jgi:hypothetical protein